MFNLQKYYITYSWRIVYGKYCLKACGGGGYNDGIIKSGCAHIVIDGREGGGCEPNIWFLTRLICLKTNTYNKQ